MCVCRCLTETGHSCRTSTRPRSPCTALRGWPSPRTVRSLWPTRATTASSSTSTCSSLVLVHDCHRLRQSLHQVLQVPLLQLMTVIDSGNHCFSSTGTCSSLVLVHDCHRLHQVLQVPAVAWFWFMTRATTASVLQVPASDASDFHQSSAAASDALSARSSRSYVR